MEYRLATVADYPAIAEFIHGTNYFLPLDPSTLGGYWLVAVDHEDRVHGTLWFFQGGGHAYVDYWAATHGLVAGKLGSLFRAMCATLGIKYVRGVIAAHNAIATRMAEGLFGMHNSGQDYNLMFTTLE